MEDCERVAASNVNVLLIGESGSGKDVAAQYIHACSRRSDMPLIAVNCNAYTESLLEAELFGHEQGAFTGAIKGRAGKFELADKSTLFLDEVGDINLTTQVKLLRAIETKRIERIGGNNSKQLDFRLITATNRDLVAKVRNSTFREDFFLPYQYHCHPHPRPQREEGGPGGHDSLLPGGIPAGKTKSESTASTRRPGIFLLIMIIRATSGS